MQVRQQGRDVTEQNAGLGIIRNGADVTFDVEADAESHERFICWALRGPEGAGTLS